VSGAQFSRRDALRLARGVAATTLSVGIAASLTACGGGKPSLVPSDDSATPVVTVKVVDNRFEPANVEVKPGEAVRWVFAGRDKHDVVAADGSFVSELVTSGEYTHVFDKAGTFMYDCSIHPEMVGTVTVK